MIENLRSLMLNEFDPFFGYIYITPLILIYLILASISDIKEKKIYDRLNLAFLILRLFAAYVYPISTRSLIGMIFGFLIILIPAMIMLVPMGGDIKFAAVLGLWIGDSGIYGSLAIGVILFVIYSLIAKKKKKDMIPMGPFISIGCVSLMAVYYAFALPSIIEYI